MQKNFHWLPKHTFLVLLALSIIVLIIFIAPNKSGAANAEMLSVFEHDEFAQYPYLLHMLTPGEGASVLQTLHNFAEYGHYYYGYPFYFFSALAALPVKLILGADWTHFTATIVMVLREIINVLPMLLAILILVWMQTRFRSFWKSLLAFLLLATIPAVVSNNLWWHPDSLLVLFCMLTLLFLQKDDLRFGRYFYLSAVACGMAIGAKVLGVLFFTVYITYLIYGLASKKIKWLQAVKHAVLFVVLMVATILISNPLLLLPLERSEIVSVFKGNLAENTQGFWIASSGIAETLRNSVTAIQNNYGGWVLVGVSLAICIWGLFRKETRLQNLLMLIWTLTYCGYFILFAATIRSHYFLPAFLPLFSVIPQAWMGNTVTGLRDKEYQSGKLFFQRIIGWLMLGLALVYIVIDSAVMAGQIKVTENKEANSASIQMFDEAYAQYLQRLPADQKFIIYRDWKAYVEPRTNWRLQMSWDLMDYDRLSEDNPDILFLESENIVYFSDSAKLDIALDSKAMQQKYNFYSDAMNESIKGYKLIFKTAFGKVFVSDELFAKYFAR